MKQPVNQTVPYTSLDVNEQKEWADKRASSIIDSVNNGMVKLDPNRLVSGYKFKNMNIMSNTGLNSRTIIKNYGTFANNTQDLIVNSQPDLPLAVPLEQSSLPKSQKIEMLKQKNLDRFEQVALNLQSQAESEKKEYVEKLKKKKKSI